ncbi:MAG: flagellar hook-length control protein FliK [Rhodospirillales bacterium]|nr:flagellar hook-length control protein FliK [Rhodospirillales bacterium]
MPSPGALIALTVMPGPAPAAPASHDPGAGGAAPLAGPVPGLPDRPGGFGPGAAGPSTTPAAGSMITQGAPDLPPTAHIPAPPPSVLTANSAPVASPAFAPPAAFSAPTSPLPLPAAAQAHVPSSPAPTATASSAPALPTPAAQLAPALFTLGRSGSSAVLTLRLEPASLGQVEVRITRPAEGPVGVQVTASQPETLLLLLRDQPALRQALDRAGLPVDPHSLSFHLAPPATPSAPVTASGEAAAAGGSGLGAGGAAARNGAPRRRRGQTASPAEAAREVAHPLPPGARWLRAGLDITA